MLLFLIFGYLFYAFSAMFLAFGCPDKSKGETLIPDLSGFPKKFPFSWTLFKQQVSIRGNVVVFIIFSVVFPFTLFMILFNGIRRFLFVLTSPIILALWLICKSFVAVKRFLGKTGRRIGYWFSGFKNGKKPLVSIEELTDFKNRQLAEIKRHLSARKKNVQKEFEKISGLVEKWNDRLAVIRSNSEFKGELERHDKNLARLRQALNEKCDSIEKVNQALKKIEEQGSALDSRLDLHVLYLEQQKIFTDMKTASPEVLNGEIESNLTASREIVRGLKMLMGDKEIAAMAKSGAPLDDLLEAAKNNLRNEGMEPVSESAEEIIREAQKILA